MESGSMEEAAKGRSTIAKGAFWGLSFDTLTKLLSFAYLIVLAQLFPASDIGIFFIGLGIFNLITTFSDLGLRQAIKRYAPFWMGQGKKEKVAGIIQGSLIVSPLLSLIFAVAVFFSADAVAGLYASPGLAVVMQYLALILMLDTVFLFIKAFLVSMKRIKERQVANTLQVFSKVALTALLVSITGATLETMALALALSYVPSLALCAVYMRKELPRLELGGVPMGIREKLSIVKEVTPLGFVISLSLFFWAVTVSIDRIMLGYLLVGEEGAALVGVYAVATSLAVLVNFFPTAVNRIFLPVASEMYGKGKTDETLEISRLSAKWIAMLVVPATLAFVCFPDTILRNLYGKEYAAGALPLVIFSLGMAIRAISRVQNSILTMLKLVNLQLMIMVFAAVLNIILNWVLIQEYGISGAAVASAFSFVTVSLLLNYHANRSFGFSFSGETYKVLGAGLAAWIIILLIKAPVLSAVGAVDFGSLEGTGLSGEVLTKGLKILVFGSLLALCWLIYGFLLVATLSFNRHEVVLVSGAMRRAGFPKEWRERAAGLMGRAVGKGQE